MKSFVPPPPPPFFYLLQLYRLLSIIYLHATSSHSPTSLHYSSCQYHRLPSILEVMRTRPINAIMLLWDSDVSDVDEASMSPQQIVSVRDYYRSNITFVIESLRQQQPDLYISMAGPVLLGERQSRYFSPISQDIFDQKQFQLDAYVRINLEMATWMEIPYINLRKAYYEVLPFYRLAYDECLTIDGEHPNSNGAYVTAKNLAIVLDGWLRESYNDLMK